MQENYYKPIKLAENTFHIYEPGNVYTTLIIGEEKALLIDTGYGFGDLAGFVRTLTDKPLEVVLTHGHTDHCGGNSQFPMVYMNMMDVPTYLWYEATQKTLIVRSSKETVRQQDCRTCGPRTLIRRNGVRSIRGILNR